MGKSLTGKNLGKGFTQRKDGLYQGTYYIGKKRKFLYDTNLRRLKQRIKEVEQVTDEEWIEKEEERKEKEKRQRLNNMTLNDVYELWVANRLMYKDVRFSTRNNYIMSYNSHLKNTIGDTKIVEMNKIFCENFLNKCKEEKRGAFPMMKAVFSQILEYAVDYGIIDVSPLIGLKMHKKKGDKRIKYLTLNDQRIILEGEWDPMFYNYMLLALNTGMRCSEICGLEMKHIHLKEKYIVVKKQLVYQKRDGKYKYYFDNLKTEKSNRIIPLNQYAIQAIENQINLRKNIKTNDEKFNDLLFINSAGSPLNYLRVDQHLNDLYRKVSKKINADKLSSHMFRHSFATNCLEYDIDSKVIQNVLGHTTSQMTDIYAHVTKTKAENSVDKLNSIKF